MTGTRIKYNIYNIYEAAPEESDYFTKETNGRREIVLATCTDNSKARLIIFAAEE
jgi:sortase (surface protein transpeptidase)